MESATAVSKADILGGVVEVVCYGFCVLRWLDEVFEEDMVEGD